MTLDYTVIFRYTSDNMIGRRFVTAENAFEAAKAFSEDPEHKGYVPLSVTRKQEWDE